MQNLKHLPGYFFWSAVLLIDILLCFFMAVCITLPLLIVVELGNLYVKFRAFIISSFETPQDEKPSPNELIKAEDQVLNEGGAFAECKTLLV